MDATETRTHHPRWKSPSTAPAAISASLCRVVIKRKIQKWRVRSENESCQKDCRSITSASSPPFNGGRSVAHRTVFSTAQRESDEEAKAAVFPFDFMLINGRPLRGCVRLSPRTCVAGDRGESGGGYMAAARLTEQLSPRRS